MEMIKDSLVYLDMLDLVTVRITSFTFITIISLLSGCQVPPNGSSMGHAEAQKLSDSYMSDLVADRVDLALGKMEPQFLLGVGGKTKAESVLRDLFNYCGRPLESDLRHEDTGFFPLWKRTTSTYAWVLLLWQNYSESKGRLLLCCKGGAGRKWNEGSEFWSSETFDGSTAGMGALKWLDSILNLIVLKSG